MNELNKTFAFAAVALVLVGAAFYRVPDRSGLNQTFNDQGEPFFPDFEDPLASTDLEVVDYDPTTATAARFKVMLKDGKWVIPSHYNYPADAKDRLAKTAAGVMDLTKDTIRSDRPEDHEDLGVIDPLDAKTLSLKGRGKRVTLRDKSEKVLADFIIGKDVRAVREGSDSTPQRYVRVPNQKRTYGVNVKVDLSTRFADWIETNLLKLDAGRVRRVVFDNYKIDPETGPQRGEVLTIERKDASGPWIMADLSADQELNPDKLRTMTDALADLKIVGVRPKPPGLTRDLKTNGPDKGGIKVTNTTIASLNSKGFYPTRDGRLLSNQGDVIVSTDEGAVYTLRFGEVVIATGEELSAGIEEDAAKVKEKAKDPAKKADGTSESRYVMVTVAFDPTLLPPEPEPDAKVLPTIPDDPFQRAPDDPKRIAEEKEAKEKDDRKKADEEKRITDARKRVQDLTDRFADWYYVTPGESFRSIVLDRAALTRPKGAAPAAGAAPAMPNIPGFPGIPGLSPH